MSLLKETTMGMELKEIKTVKNKKAIRRQNH